MTRPLQSWRLFVCVGLFGVGLGAWGQGAPGGQYAGESIVLEKSEAIYQMAADGTGSRVITKVARIQSEAVLREVGVVSIAYAANSEKVEFVFVRARHPDGTVVDTPGSEAIEISPQVTQQAPFYSDLKQKQIPVRSLKVGDTLEWQVRVTKTKAEAPGQFWGSDSFVDEAVVLSEVVELRAPKDKAVTVWSPLYKPTETIDGGERVWRWEHSQLKPTTGPAAEAEKEAKKKKVWTAEQELDAKEGKLPDVAWTTFKSWAEVGVWYRGLEGERMSANADVKAKAAEVTAGKTTEEAKIRAVYGYVATQVRYVGVAFGIGRYQPHEAGDVLQNQYGDCKDKHTLLAAMLGALGLHPDAVMIGAGIRFNEAVPSPAAFNHLITRVMVDGKPVWLDTTSEVAPYQVLLVGIRDHPGLVVPETGAARVEKTPAELPFKALQTMEANGVMSKDGVATSRMVITIRGDDEVYLRAVMRQIAPAQYDLLAQKMSEGMGYGGKATHAEVSRAEDTDQPFKMSYDYKREAPSNWGENKQMLPQVAPVSLPMVDDKDPPVQSLNLGQPRVETSHSTQKVPDGWGVELPEAIHAKSPWATVDQTYKFDKGLMSSERRVEVLQEKVPVANWKEYKKFAETANLGMENYVQLVHFEAAGAEDVTKDSPSVGSENASTKASNPAAAKLIQAAMKSLQQMDTKSAREQLDEAKSINPEQQKLWLAYGTLETALGAATAAFADFERELALHPGTSAVYGPMAGLQIHRGQTKEAEATLHKWETLDERNPVPAKMLAQLLMNDGDYFGAAAEAKAAIGSTPEGEDKDQQLRYLLGQAQLKAGMKESGRKTLVDLLAETDDAGMMNNAAYALADAGVEYPLAEKITRAALGKMEVESQAWTLDERPQTLKAKTETIEATWDTLGWILYREGKKEEGAQYIRAAWLNRQTAEVGEHLGDIALAKGDKSAALLDYEMALSTFGGRAVLVTLQSKEIQTPTNFAQQRSVLEKEITDKADELKKAGTKSTVQQGGVSLQKLRTLQLGPANGLNGTAEYRLLLGAEKIQRVGATGEKTLPDGDKRLLQADFKGWVPEGSKAALVKVVLLNCHSGTCDLVIEP